MAMKLRRGDTVQVVAGRDKGPRGEVWRVVRKEARLVVQGVNLRKKHQKQVQAGGRTMTPGIIQFEAPMDVSNVMFVCPKCNELTRLGGPRPDGGATRGCKN